MQFSKLHLVLSLLPSTLAQYGGGSGSSSTSVASASAPTTSSFTPSNVKIIDVGENGLTFSPNTTTADIGDTIEFHFYPAQHSVAQSSFDSPCVPLNNGTGFWSGGFSTDSGENNNVFSVLINDTNPIWFYCAAPTHCQNGMAGVINPPTGTPSNRSTRTDASTSLTNYIAAAKDVPTSKGGTAVSGGTVGPAKPATTGSGTPTTSGSAKPSASKSAGVEARGEAQWLVAAFGSVVAVGMGALMI
ncbi:Extracellular serine-rich protein [Lachnellula hyalina]|uniref:Extracellular serine-rich protein n=1 Tax=Lachnellula hyalina TaxID=1316788 RepID=A0A8H8QXV1_9HELO|nr:Extracellular serine-rich protein [Lachnellula hyalina]TVY24857.1 Extracellular serine-rich protein [Lachnellula hyalina]